MKNNKLPLKERYKNFIQKHPKFWLTFIYCILMLALAVTMLITVLNPPNNKTASADYQMPTECPAGFERLRIVNANLSITAADVNNLLSDLPTGEYRYVTAPSILLRIAGSPPNVVTALSFRYICCVSVDIGIGISRQFYLSNSNSNPVSGGMPSDALIIASNRMSSFAEFETFSTFIVSDYNFGAIRYITTLFDNYSNYYYYQDLCNVGGSCSPDDLKAEYDKGHSDGYTDGYDVGYNKGKTDGSDLVSVSPITFLLSPISSLLGTPIWGQFTIGSLFSVVLFVGCTLIFIKMFAGG